MALELILSIGEITYPNKDHNFWEFSTKESAINYAKNNKIKFEILEPKERKIFKKSYSDNFTK